ncbi:MAG: cob(I)yrinic acid a,c-diamide adenosyltransferase [Spirochaetia bacterium]
MEPGIIIVFTGNGKGKTSAAMGTVLRAAGHHLKVCIIQFIKHEKVVCGEQLAVQNYFPDVEIHTLGLGFVRSPRNREKHQKQAQKALSFAAEKIASGRYDLVVLDELTHVVALQLIEENEILNVLKGKPRHVHLVITGRDATPGLIQAADLVTDCRQVKHPYESGRSAIKGIDF